VTSVLCILFSKNFRNLNFGLSVSNFRLTSRGVFLAYKTVKVAINTETNFKELMVMKTFLKIFKSRSKKYFVVQDHKMSKKKSPAAAVVKAARYLKFKFKVLDIYIFVVFLLSPRI
jgi:hypothetical protein